MNKIILLMHESPGNQREQKNDFNNFQIAYRYASKEVIAFIRSTCNSIKLSIPSPHFAVNLEQIKYKNMHYFYNYARETSFKANIVPFS